MPEFLSGLLAPALEAGAEAAPGALSAAAPEAFAAAAPEAFGSAASLGSAGLPFAAGAGELGSVATGLGPYGVSGFGDAAGIASALGAGGLATGAGAGVPFAAGAGQIGSTAGSGLDSAISGALPGLDSAVLPANAQLTSGPALNFPGMGAGAGVDPSAAASAGVSGDPFSAPGVSNWSAGATPTAPTAGATSAASAGGGVTDWLSKNSTTLGLGAAGVGASLLSPFLSRAVSPPLPNQGQLTATADKATAQANDLLGQQKALTDPLTTGVLPAAQQQAIDNATNDAITTVKSKYAGMGLSGSTMELEAINNVKNQAATAKVSMETQLAQTGLQMGNQALADMNLTDQVYTTIMNATLSQDQSLQQAIARMAGAAAQGSALGTAINSKPASSTTPTPTPVTA